MEENINVGEKGKETCMFGVMALSWALCWLLTFSISFYLHSKWDGLINRETEALPSCGTLNCLLPCCWQCLDEYALYSSSLFQEDGCSLIILHFTLGRDGLTLFWASKKSAFSLIPSWWIFLSNSAPIKQSLHFEFLFIFLSIRKIFIWRVLVQK